MPEKEKEFKFSPLVYHHHVMRKTGHIMAYNGGNVEKWQYRLRRKLYELVGLMPDKRVNLNVRQLWKKQHEFGTIEKIVFTSEPYADVPAYFCFPHHVNKPYPVMICLQGHNTGMHNSIAAKQNNECRSQEIEGDRDYAIACMEHGIGSLCLEQRAFGERSELLQNRSSGSLGCHNAAMRSLFLGRTLIGERVFDVDRAIDYLSTRIDVDTKRIGIMGDSGGGTISIYAAAMLKRITLAVPSCSFCTFVDSIMSIRHCADNYVPKLFLYAEMADIMGLFAPKPVIIVAGRDDPIFPVKAVHRAFKNLKRIYAAADSSDRCHLIIGAAGHRFYAEKSWPIILAEFNNLK
jgi:dienelactone hydrolase